MRKVRYVPAYDNKSYHNLTFNKVYDVISSNDRIITLLNDNGIPYIYSFNSYGTRVFIDVTEEYRNEIIDSILK